MPPPVIPTLPDWPNRNERPEAFNAKVNAFLPGMNPWSVAVNAVGSWMQAALTDISAKSAAVAQALADVVTLRNQAQQFALTAVNAPGTMATSTSTMALGAGAKALTLQTGKSLVPGQTIVASVQGDASKRMSGPLLTYDPATGAATFDCEQAFGAGTYSAWRVGLAPSSSIPVAAVADYWAGTDNGKAGTAATMAALQLYRPITDAPSLAWDINVHGLFASVVLGGNRTLPTPANLKIGDYIEIQVIQPPSGGPRTLAVSNAFKFGRAGAPVLSTAAGAIDLIRGKVLAISPAVIIDASFRQVF
ncbi:hypothetical protein [Phenylobacterium sp.]|uniref:hypothetical protein n=1 Tax=Phenylobacterium sp. TaxID=1871053 RepID=UPI0035AFC5D4